MTPSLKAGIGRIEPVQDARHAVYILQELADIARVSTDKSTEEILEFARLISELKNERFFDARLKRIYELQMVDSFLLAQDYLLEYDAAYFATLADFWANGGSPQRLSGQRISLAFIPDYLYEWNKDDFIMPNDYEDTYKRNTIGIYGGVEYVREKPINLTWQNSIDAALYYGWTQQKDINEYGGPSPSETLERTIRLPLLQAGFAQRFGYFPNTRTSARAGYNLQYVHFFDATDVPNKVQGREGNGLRLGGNFNMNYYFSPQLRFSANWEMIFIWQDSDDGVSLDYFFRPGQHGPIPHLSNYNDFMKRGVGHMFTAGFTYSFF